MTTLAPPRRRQQTFRGGPFSNFAVCHIILAHPFTDEPFEYLTVEHRFQAMKALNADDHDYVAGQGTAQEARWAGGPAHRIPARRSDLRSIACRPDWDDIREAVMWEALQVKFAQPAFRMALLHTGNSELAEHAPWDPYWGLGPDGNGANRLGQMLTALRDALIPRAGRVYAGIGSRSTPPDMLALLEQLARRMARDGWRVRTGLAAGADQAFYRAGGPVELYLPDHGFQSAARRPAEGPEVFCLDRPSPDAHLIAQDHHPAWHRLSRDVRQLMARNVHQILGCQLDDPVAFVCCWTPDGSLDGTSRQSGGTGMALRLATTYGIPVRNLARPDHRDAAHRLLAT